MTCSVILWLRLHTARRGRSRYGAHFRVQRGNAANLCGSIARTLLVLTRVVQWMYRASHVSSTYLLPPRVTEVRLTALNDFVYCRVIYEEGARTLFLHAAPYGRGTFCRYHRLLRVPLADRAHTFAAVDELFNTISWVSGYLSCVAKLLTYLDIAYSCIMADKRHCQWFGFCAWLDPVSFEVVPDVLTCAECLCNRTRCMPRTKDCNIDNVHRTWKLSV